MTDENMLDAPEVGLAQEALSGGFQLRNTNTGKCLTVSGGSGSDTFLQACSGGSTQRWGFDGGFLKHIATGLCVDVENASVANGAAVQVYDCTSGDNQDFRFYPYLTSSGLSVTNWYLIAKHSSKCVQPGGTGGIYAVQSSTCQGAWNVVF